ncbi:MAG: hypothetical protein QM690_07840 [Sphingobium sp.]
MLQTRTITTDRPYRSREISPGVFFESFYPGGINGPNDELSIPTPGGQSWTDLLLLGTPEDDFQFMLPDIRMPANQYWPLHWHDCWTVVLVVEGQCCIGDWWMEPGDVFITAPSIEYGPLLIGPNGCRLFEIFAQAHLSPGGYAPEYHDHPTLRLSPGRLFLERSELNKRNEGRQILPCDGIEGIWKSRLAPGTVWNLGDPDDPLRGVMKDTRLMAGEHIAPHSYGDWHALLVMDGSLTVNGETLVRDDFLRIAPDSPVGEIEAGADGAQLLELARTANGLTPRPLS